MVERNVKVITKDNPVLLDKVIQSIQETLADKLEWLQYAFGRAYKLVRHEEDGNKFIYPAAYIGNSEYASLQSLAVVIEYSRSFNGLRKPPSILQAG